MGVANVPTMSVYIYTGTKMKYKNNKDTKIINYSHKNKVYEFLVCVFSVSLLLALFFSIYFLLYIVSDNYV